MKPIYKFLLIISIIAMTGCSGDGKQSTAAGENPTQQLLEKSELEHLWPKALRIKRNEIFARYGRIFQSKDLRDHFSQFDWYKPEFEDVTDRLTEIDKQNIQLLLGMENTIKAQPIAKKVIGQWASIKYIRTLDQTKSQRAAYNEGGVEVLELRADSTSLIIFNFHEGIDPKYSLNYAQINFGDIPFEQLGAEFMDYHTIHFQVNQVVDTLVRFDVWDGEQRTNLAINQLVFEGTYLNSQSNDTVRFERNGTLNGLADFAEYKAVESFIGPGLDVDILRLYTPNEEEPTELTWIRNGNQLNLYAINCTEYDTHEEECWRIERAKLLYSLKRIDPPSTAPRPY